MNEKEQQALGYAVSVALSAYDEWHDDCPKCKKDKDNVCKDLETMRGDLLDAWKAITAKDVIKEGK